GALGGKAEDEALAEAMPLAQAEKGIPERRKQYYYLPLMIIAIVIIVAILLFVDRPTDFEGYVKRSGYLGVLLMGIIGSASPIWPLPGSWAAFIAGGLGLNPIVLALAAGFGEPVGEATAYMAGYGGQVAITKWKRYERVEGWMKRHGAIALFLVSAVPNNLTKVAVIAAGALRYPWWKFFLLCWGGKTIKSFAFAMAGAGFFNVALSLIERIF
ncbi:MAG: VTT domain-containing protein, partial [Planctomycetota bacterium]|nr:VTT domain-containing protein [Planctomycetota bacterium]